MESRKVQISAGGSFFVVLPKEWSKELNLKKGDRLDVVLEEDGSIRLYPSSVSRELTRESVLHSDKYPSAHALDLYIKANYMNGCNIISIQSNKRIESEVKKTIKFSAAELIGVEIAEETSDKIILRVIVNPAGFPLAGIIKRVSALSLSMYSDVVKAFQEQDLALATDVVERGNEAMKLYRLMVRQLMLAQHDRTIAKSLGIESTNTCISLGIVARDLSRLIYHISTTAQKIVEILKSEISYGEKIMNLITSTFNAVEDMLRETFQALLEKDIGLAWKIMERMGKIQRLDEQLTSEIFEVLGDVHTAVRLSRVMLEIRRIAEHSLAIADDTMFYESTLQAQLHLGKE